jgi:hypothetical protein
MNARRIAALAAPMVSALTLVMLASPASAGIPVLGTGNVWIENVTAASADLCGSGAVDDPTYLAGEWEVSAIGSRVGGLPIAQASPPHIGASLPKTCLTVYTNSTLAGAFAGTLTLAAAGTSDVAVVCEVLVQWGATSTPHEVAGVCNNDPGVPGI